MLCWQPACHTAGSHIRCKEPHKRAELMECDLHDALGQESLQEQLAWRKRGVSIALDIARGLVCESLLLCYMFSAWAHRST